MKTAGSIHSFILLTACLFLVTAGCMDADRPETPERVKIGLVFPMTGDLAENGWDCLHGITLAVGEINAAGGIESLGGATLELVYADSQGVPAVGSREAERLITEEEVAAIIGTYQSRVAMPVTTVAERLETPCIISAGIADIITERGFRYTFRMQSKARNYGMTQVAFLSDPRVFSEYPIRKVALIYENSDYGTSVALAQKEALRRQGIGITAFVSYHAETVTNLDEEIEELLASDPDAILQVAYLEDSIIIRRAIYRHRPDIILIDAAGGPASPEYMMRLGPLSEGVMTVTEYSVEDDTLAEHFFRYSGREINGDSAYSYLAVWVLKDALERSGSVDRHQLRDALAETKMTEVPFMAPPSGYVQFDDDGQNIHSDLHILQIQDGKYIPVWPREHAGAEIRIPGVSAS